MNGFKSSMKAPEKEREFYKPVKNSLPPTIDWRRFGFVTPIKDQGITNLDEIFTNFINNSIEYHNSRGRYK